MANYSLTETSCCCWEETGKRRYVLVPLAGQPEENQNVMIARAYVSVNSAARSIQMGSTPN